MAALILVGLLVIPLSRAPQLIGGQTFPDGDESVIALMAKHMAEGRHFPVFAYGQSYGLSFFEAGAAAVAFKLAGMSDVALKSAILFLWSLGWVFFTLAAREFGGTRTAWIAGLALLVFPAWAGCSMKAWGGTVTGFVFMNLLLWRLAHVLRQSRIGVIDAGGLGASLALTLLAQPIRLPALLPFILLLVLSFRGKLHGKTPKSRVAAAGAGFAVVLALAYGPGRADQPTYWSPAIFAGAAPAAALGHLPQRFWGELTGAFWMIDLVPAGIFPRITAGLWVAALIAAVAVASARWERDRFSPLLASVFSVLIVLAASLFLSDDLFMYRYLLPTAEPLVLATALSASALVEAADSRRRLAVGSAVAVLIAGGAFSLVEFRNISLAGIPSEGNDRPAESVEQLVRALRSAGVGHVYCTDPMLQWTLMYASREAVLARWIDPRDRLPEIPAAVDRALREGRRVAIVGYAAQAPMLGAALRQTGRKTDGLRVVNATFFVMLDPDPRFIRQVGFRAGD